MAKTEGQRAREGTQEHAIIEISWERPFLIAGQVIYILKDKLTSFSTDDDDQKKKERMAAASSIPSFNERTSTFFFLLRHWISSVNEVDLTETDDEGRASFPRSLAIPCLCHKLYVWPWEWECHSSQKRAQNHVFAF